VLPLEVTCSVSLYEITRKFKPHKKKSWHSFEEETDDDLQIMLFACDCNEFDIAVTNLKTG
jgi:hypothetical protein